MDRIKRINQLLIKRGVYWLILGILAVIMIDRFGSTDLDIPLTDSPGFSHYR